MPNGTPSKNGGNKGLSKLQMLKLGLEKLVQRLKTANMPDREREDVEKKRASLARQLAALNKREKAKWEKTKARLKNAMEQKEAARKKRKHLKQLKGRSRERALRSKDKERAAERDKARKRKANPPPVRWR